MPKTASIAFSTDALHVGQDMLLAGVAGILDRRTVFKFTGKTNR